MEWTAAGPKAKLEERQPVAWSMTQAGGMWRRQPAAAIRKTGWGTAEDILVQTGDFPCRSICGDPKPERILACQAESLRVSKEGSGNANPAPPQHRGHWEGSMADVQGLVQTASFCLPEPCLL